MTTDLVKKCASDLCVVIWGMDYRPRPGMMPDARWSTALHATLAVIDALAGGVSDEMALAAMRTYFVTDESVDPNSAKARWFKRTITAAIRAAKSREGA